MLQVQTDLRRTQAELSLYLLLKCPCLFWCFVNLVEICFAGIQEVLKLLISSQLTWWNVNKAAEEISHNKY